MPESSGHETLTCSGFPECLRIKLRTNTPLRRIKRTIRRRTRFVSAFPDGKSGLDLAAARPHNIAGTRRSSRMYMDMIPPDPDQTGGAVLAQKSRKDL